MQGTYRKSGDVSIHYNPFNGDMLLSPDGEKHFLPCDSCGKPDWQNLNVVAFVCRTCEVANDN